MQTPLVRFQTKRAQARFCPATRSKKPAFAGFLLRVAGPGIEPGSGGYAYHYNFRYLEKSNLLVWTIPSSFSFE